MNINKNNKHTEHLAEIVNDEIQKLKKSYYDVVLNLNKNNNIVGYPALTKPMKPYYYYYLQVNMGCDDPLRKTLK